MKHKFTLFYIFTLFLFLSCQDGITIYVDANTDNQSHGVGTSSSPYKSFTDAFAKIKEIREDKPNQRINLLFKEGTYYFKKGFLLDRNLSNLSISSYKNQKVIFSGGIKLNTDKIEYSTDTDLKVVDLASFNIEDFGEIHNIGFSRPSQNSYVELFVDNQPMHLSRWPNDKEIAMGKIIDTGSIPRDLDFSNRGAVMTYDSLRISKWEESDDIWISGYFKHGYADDALRIKEIDRKKKTLTTDGPTLYGFGSGSPWNKYHFFNVKDEVDAEGEFYLDKKEQKLYFMTKKNEINKLVLSELSEPFFDIYQAKDLTISGITFECSRAPILTLVESENVDINNCVFRNSGNLAIMVGNGIEPFNLLLHEGIGKPTRKYVGSLQQHLYADNSYNRNGGTNNLIRNSKFYNLGAGAVSLGGGDRKTLTPGNNIVKNCVFHDNNRVERSYRPAVHLTGVGNKVLNSEIYNTPSMAILMHGNNHLIQNNYIHHACLEVEDQGAFYYGRNPSECGTEIKENIFAFIPDTYSTCAIYNDDGAGGLIVNDNIFYRAGKYGVLLGGGSDNNYRNNLFVDMQYGLHVDNRLQNWSKSLLKNYGLFEVRLKDINYNQSPYIDQYPYLDDYLRYNGKPRRNVVANSSFVNVKQLSDHPKWIIWENINFRTHALPELSEENLDGIEKILTSHPDFKGYLPILNKFLAEKNKKQTN